jgi:hypothetical protein
MILGFAIKTERGSESSVYLCPFLFYKTRRILVDLRRRHVVFLKDLQF